MRKRSTILQLAREFILAQGGTVQHVPRDDAAAHARLAAGHVAPNPDAGSVVLAVDPSRSTPQKAKPNV